MPGESVHHGRRGSLVTSVFRLAGLPAIVVKNGEHGKGRFQVSQFLGEAQRQAVEPVQENPLRAVSVSEWVRDRLAKATKRESKQDSRREGELNPGSACCSLWTFSKTPAPPGRGPLSESESGVGRSVDGISWQMDACFCAMVRVRQVHVDRRSCAI